MSKESINKFYNVTLLHGRNYVADPDLGLDMSPAQSELLKALTLRDLYQMQRLESPSVDQASKLPLPCRVIPFPVGRFQL